MLPETYNETRDPSEANQRPLRVAIVGSHAVSHEVVPEEEDQDGRGEVSDHVWPQEGQPKRVLAASLPHLLHQNLGRVEPAHDNGRQRSSQQHQIGGREVIQNVQDF